MFTRAVIYLSETVWRLRRLRSLQAVTSLPTPLSASQHTGTQAYRLAATRLPLLAILLTFAAALAFGTSAPALSNAAAEQDSEQPWPMLAANPQRTSWTPEEVRGNLSVAWYAPIEPYIPYKIQPIAANGKIYVSTARGLYAFNASNGSKAWVYPTHAPLGHSPTAATVNNKSVVFVGGYDRKVHAVNAETGQPMAGYAAYEAGAGFETNPLIVNNTIYAGNRDGYFYALDAASGSLKWRYKTEGPVLFSAAYKDGRVYFASNDAHAYALNAENGALIWKSARLPGSGFHTFWPVIYTEKASGKDYVIVTGGENYRFLAKNLVIDESETVYAGLPDGGLIGTASTSIAGDWAPGTVAIDAGILTEYYETQPYRRTVFVLDADTGQEYTFDSDKDGKAEYAPFNWSGVTHSGTKFPPIVNGTDGVYYQAAGFIAPGWISRGGPVGWKFGTKYISRVMDRDVAEASDEPMGYSSGGKLIYYALCCDRIAGAMDVTMPYGAPNRAWDYYMYNLANNVLAPGYQQMYNSGDASDYNHMDGWQTYRGKDKSANGIYGKHGSNQSPPIPYQGKVFLLKGNALIALSPTGSGPKTPLPLAQIVPAQPATTLPTPAELAQRLDDEVAAILAAGPLRPGYHDSGLYDVYGNGWFTDEREAGEIYDYFQSPADTVYTLLLTHRFLAPSRQQEVKKYLQEHYGPGAKYDFTRIVHVGWGAGAAREAFEIPPDMVSTWGEPYHSPLQPSTQPTCGICGYWKSFPPFSFYAAWQYAAIVGGGQSFAKNVFDRMSGKLESPPSDSLLIAKPHWLNQYIAGYQGFLELQKLAGYPQSQAVQDTYQRLLDLRTNHFTKDTPYPPLGSSAASGELSYLNHLAVARNFMFLTPDLAAYLRQTILSQVQEAVAEYEAIAPYWFVTKFDDTYGEGTLHHLYDSPALFQAKAYILGEPYDELAQWIDVPAFQRGDLFYIQNLVAALASTGTTPPLPTPTPKRKVYIPQVSALLPFEPAIFWFGGVSPTSNYADVRTWYYDEAIEVTVHIIDRLLWKDDTPSPSDLTDWDAVSVFISLGGNTGQHPDSGSFRFVKQLWNTDNPESKAAFQGNGADWMVRASLPFRAEDGWRGNGPNDGEDDKGWLVSFRIPFTSLGLDGAPPAGAEWGLAVAVHDRDDAAGSAIADRVWPEGMDPMRPATWGSLHFGVPAPDPLVAEVQGTTTVRQGLNGSVVPDAHVGGHTICGEGIDHWSEWGEANYAGYEQINIQNQWDVSDYPCFSKYYVTFPLTSLPAGKSIVSATVTLNLFGNSGYKPGDAQPSAIDVLTVAEDWSEQTITWNNAPLPSENISVTWVDPIDGYDPGAPYAWKVGRAVADAYQRGEPLRLAFYSTDGEMHSGKYFWSSDVADWNAQARPTLTVAWGEPAGWSSTVFLPSVLRR